jgi:hypothetical protein
MNFLANAISALTPDWGGAWPLLNRHDWEGAAAARLSGGGIDSRYI